MARIGGWAFIIGLIIAIAGAAGLTQAWFGWLLAILGLIVGFMNVQEGEVKTFLLAAIGLMLTATALGQLPYVGEFLDRLVANIVTFIGSAVLVVALRALFVTARD